MTNKSCVDTIDASCESVKVDDSVVTTTIVSHTVDCPIELINGSRAETIVSQCGVVTLAGSSSAESITTDSIHAKVFLLEQSKADYIETYCAPVTLDNCRGIIDIETKGTGGDVILNNNSSADSISTINSAVYITNSRVLKSISTQGAGGKIELLDNTFAKEILTSGGDIVMKNSRATSLSIDNGRLYLQGCIIDGDIIHKGIKPFFLSGVSATGAVSTECALPILGKDSKISALNWTPKDVKTSPHMLSNASLKPAQSPLGSGGDQKSSVHQLTVSGTIEKLTTDYTGNAELRVVLKGQGKINGTLDGKFTLVSMN